MFNSYPRRVDVYNHYPQTCNTCGYVSDSGYWDPEGFYLHVIHTITDSNVLMDRIARQNKVESKQILKHKHDKTRRSPDSKLSS